MSAKREKAPKDLGEVATGRQKKKTQYMPDETGHMVEWAGDHPIFVGRWTKADDEEEETNNNE